MKIENLTNLISSLYYDKQEVYRISFKQYFNLTANGNFYNPEISVIWEKQNVSTYHDIVNEEVVFYKKLFGEN